MAERQNSNSADRPNEQGVLAAVLYFLRDRDRERRLAEEHIDVISIQGEEATMIGVNNVNIPKSGPETPCLALRPREAAKALGISERLLWEWIRRGMVPYARIGGVVVCPTDALREWLQRQAEAEHAGDVKKTEIDA